MYLGYRDCATASIRDFWPLVPIAKVTHCGLTISGINAGGSPDQFLIGTPSRTMTIASIRAGPHLSM